MHRIDHPTKLIDANGAGKDGFTNGDPGVTPRTIADDAIFNALQEEIANTVEGASITLVKGTNTQLLSAVTAFSNQCKSAMYSFTAGGGGTTSTDFGLTSIRQDTGFSLSGGNSILVPTTGIYLVTLSGAGFVNTSVLDPTRISVRVRWDGVNLVTFGGTRYSIDPLWAVDVPGVCTINVTDAADPISFRPGENNTTAPGAPDVAVCVVARLRG
jgi:hypothetical protein